MNTVTVVKDLRFLFGPARNQGARPTCLAFAASDNHAAARGDWQPLSCEYLFYHAQRRANRSSTQAALPTSILDALRYDGQPDESRWPYLVKVQDESGWAPPENVEPLFGRNAKGRRLEISDIVSSIEAGNPLILLITLSRSFYQPSSDGLLHPIVGEVPEPQRRHAVVAVGHGLIGQQRTILVRNSWGSRWGDNGHAWLTEEFLGPRLRGAIELMEDLHVPGRSAAA